MLGCKQLERTHPGHRAYVYNCKMLGIRLDTTEEIALFRNTNQGHFNQTLPPLRPSPASRHHKPTGKQHLDSDD
jgi:hypothetical protein